VRFDLNRDGQINRADFEMLIADLMQTRAGDANLDQRFNSADLVSVFSAAEYEDGVAGNSTWAEGDWNCDGDFSSGDIISAFVAGWYSAESRPVQLDAELRSAAVADREIGLLADGVTPAGSD